MAPLPSGNNMVAELRLRYQDKTIATANRFARPTHYRRFATCMQGSPSKRRVIGTLRTIPSKQTETHDRCTESP